MIHSLSPLDGRYEQKTAELADFFSEQALIYFRVVVEMEWFLFLSSQQSIAEMRAISPEEEQLLRNIVHNFTPADAQRVKDIEKTTNHDVKAVEYFLKEKIQNTSLESLGEWIHFGCTSEDINNLSYALMLRDAHEKCMLPALKELSHMLTQNCQQWKSVPMVARTHGQPASPTTMGKAWLNFSARLKRQIRFLEQQEYLGKINGATGNFNAHISAYPDADWLAISQQFVESLGLTWQPVSDQIEPHDCIAELSHTAQRINTILIHFSRDVWGYISLGFFTQKLRAGEIGSSTMPHKVNPIDFENAEGNLGMANAVFQFFAEKLPLTRWQRDLTDSTVLRNLGVAFGHTLLALKSLKKGIGKLEINEAKLQQDLDQNREVLAEAVQTVMRKYGVENPYEKLKELTRGKRITREEYEAFVASLEIPDQAKEYLSALTPSTYIGLAEEIVERFM